MGGGALGLGGVDAELGSDDDAVWGEGGGKQLAFRYLLLYYHKVVWAFHGSINYSSREFTYRRRDFCFGEPGEPMRWNQTQVKSWGVIGIVKGWMGHIVRLVYIVGRTVVMVLLRGNVSDVAESGNEIGSDESALFSGRA